MKSYICLFCNKLKDADSDEPNSAKCPKCCVCLSCHATRPEHYDPLHAFRFKPRDPIEPDERD